MVSSDRQRIIGWVTQHDVIHAMAQRITDAGNETAQGTLSAEWGDPHAAGHLHTPSYPLEGYRLFEVPITADSALVGHRVDRVELPPGAIAAAVTAAHRTVVARDDTVLHAGDRLHVLVHPAPADGPAETEQEYTEAGGPGVTKHARIHPLLRWLVLRLRVHLYDWNAGWLLGEAIRGSGSGRRRASSSAGTAAAFLRRAAGCGGDEGVERDAVGGAPLDGAGPGCVETGFDHNVGQLLGGVEHGRVLWAACPSVEVGDVVADDDDGASGGQAGWRRG